MNRPLVPWTLAYLVGLVLGYLFPFSRWLLLPYLTALTLTLSLALAYRVRQKTGRTERRFPRILPFLLILTLLGHLRLGLESFSTPEDRLSPLPVRVRTQPGWATSEPVDLEGLVTSPPEQFPDKIRFNLEVGSVFSGDETYPAMGTVRISLYGYWAQPPAYGDRLSIRKVKLRPPRGFHNFGGFDYGEYLIREGVSALGSIQRPEQLVILAREQGSSFWAFFYHLRADMLSFLDWAAEDPDRAFVKAMVLGERRAMPPEATETFNRSGIAHLLAISGANIGMVALAAYGLLRPLISFIRFDLFPRLPWTLRPSRVASLLTLGPVLFFALLVTGGYSVARATVMVAVYLVARALDRGRELFYALILAALAILLVQPLAFLDAGFQLSFVAVVGIIFALRPSASNPSADEGSPSPSVRHWLGQFLRISLCTSLFTFPLVAYHFQRVSLVGPLTNLVAIPLSSLAIPLGLSACLLSLVSWHLALIPLQASLFLFALLFQAAKLMAQPAWASIPLPPPSVLTLTSLYLLLSGLAYWLSKAPGLTDNAPPRQSGKDVGWGKGPLLRGRPGPWLAAASALVLIFSLTWHHFPGFSPDKGRLEVTFMDVDQGDAAFLRLPGGQTMMVDGGGLSFGSFDVGEGVVTPFLRQERVGKIDFLVASHPDRDHIHGFAALLQNFPVGRIWHNGDRSSAPFYDQIEELAHQEKVPFFVPEFGTLLEVRDGLRIQALNVGQLLGKGGKKKSRDNNRSLVVKVSYGEVSFLFTGDLEIEGQRALLQSETDLHSTVLKVPHHGGASSSHPAFWEQVRPKVAIISVGKYNRFGHPSPKVVQALETLGTRIYRTDQEGCIRVVTDGKEWTVETYEERQARGRWALVPWF